jgi:hypothetical protein
MTRKLEEEDRARVEGGHTGLLYQYKGIVPIPSFSNILTLQGQRA